jgi:hypothetical protein
MGSQGYGNRKKNPEHCPDDEKQPHRAKGNADIGPRTREHQTEKHEHETAREDPPSTLDEPEHAPIFSRIAVTQAGRRSDSR